MNFFPVLVLFIIWRIADFLIIYLSPKIIPYLGFFPYVQELKKFHLPYWIYSLANFDGIHYIKIAQHGYEQYEQAFFPLYPLLIRFLKPFLFNNALLAGTLISNCAFLLGLWFFSKYIKLIFPKQNIFPLIIVILLFPSSFFFGALYTEGLFFFLVVLSLYFLEKKRYFLAGIFGFLTSLTRFMGMLLVIPFAIYVWKKKSLFSILSSRFSLLVISPLLGLIGYSLYLFKTTGDPLFFLTSQPLFGAHRSTNIIFLPQVYFRYLKIFFTAQFDFRYLISLFEFTIFTFVFIILIVDLFANLKFMGDYRLEVRNYNRLGINIFSFVNLLLPTFTGTFSSIPRYALFSLSFFVFFAGIKNKWIMIFSRLLFFLLHILLLGFFSQGYFVS